MEKRELTITIFSCDSDGEFDTELIRSNFMKSELFKDISIGVRAHPTYTRLVFGVKSIEKRRMLIDSLVSELNYDWTNEISTPYKIILEEDDDDKYFIICDLDNKYFYVTAEFEEEEEE